jgi:hypothetical protein
VHLALGEAAVSCSDPAAKQDPGAEPRVLCPSDDRAKQTHSLVDDFPGLKVKQKSKKHHPTSSSEWTASQVDSPIMLNNRNFMSNI